LILVLTIMIDVARLIPLQTKLEHKMKFKRLSISAAVLLAMSGAAYGQAKFGVTVPTVNVESREQVTAQWKRYGLIFGREDRIMEPNWSGTSFPACIAGTTSVAWQEMNARQLNVFRSLIGINNVSNQGGDDLKEAQAAALLQFANFPTVTHTPDANSKCFTQVAASGSGRSNLGGGFSPWSAIDNYMNDGGDNNYFVGHRVSLTRPSVASVASGGAGITASRTSYSLNNAIMPVTEPSTDIAYVAWPSPGYFPAELLPSDSLRWSVGCEGCYAKNAQVSMEVGGVNLPVLREPFFNAFGFVGTLVWKVPPEYMSRFVTRYCTGGDGCYNNPKQFADSTATIRVTGMTDGNLQPLPSFEYKVTVFNAELAPAGTATAPIMPTTRYDGLWSANGGSTGFALSAGAAGTLTGIVYGASAANNGEWYKLADGRWTGSTTFQGKLFLVAVDGTQTLVGGATFNFGSPASATATYTINGASGSEELARLAVGNETYDWQVHNATGIWATSEASPSRLIASQDFRSIAGIYATFDGTTPVWYRLGTASFGTGDGSARATTTLINRAGVTVGAATLTVGAKGQTLTLATGAGTSISNTQLTRAPESVYFAGDATIALSKRGGIDLDGNGNSQLVVRNDAAGLLQVGRLVNNQFQWSTTADPGTGFRVLGAVDLANSGKSDLLFQSTTQGEFGDVTAWRGFSPATPKFIRSVKTAWSVQALGDMDGDGKGDIVWRWQGNDADTGVSYIWFTDINGATPVNQVRKRGGAPLSWKLLGAADVNGDGAADMVYVSPDNQIRVLMATGSAAAPRTCANYAAGAIPAGFAILKFADFTGARRGGDILIRNLATGEVRLISLVANGVRLPAYSGDPNDRNASCTNAGSAASISTIITSLGFADASWSYAASGDFNGDGVFDIAWRQPSGNLALWLIPLAGAPTVVSNAGSMPPGFAPIALQ
jgi:hypothetical protein